MADSTKKRRNGVCATPAPVSVHPASTGRLCAEVKYTMSFTGTKLALFLGPRLLVILRDETVDIPFPGHWDFPGGGRENDETPQECTLRETYEEVGLALAPEELTYARCYPRPDGDSWFFAAHLSEARVADIRFGDEGQGWELMTSAAYIAHPLGIPRFKDRLQNYLQNSRSDAT